MDLGLEFREELWQTLKRLEVSIGKTKEKNTCAKANVANVDIRQVEERSLGSWTSIDKVLLSH